MEETEKYAKILSVQPFWEAEKKNRSILMDPDLGGPVAVAYELAAGPDIDGLTSVPGIGLLGIMFSLEKDKPQAIICGLLNKSKKVPLYGAHHILCCQFFPGQFTRLFGIPSHEVTDVEAPLEDFIRVGSFPEEIALADGFDNQMEIVKRFIGEWKNRKLRDTSDGLVQYLMKDALQRHGSLQIAQLEKETGYSARYLQKVMLEHVGLAPKTALNNIRFQSVLQRLLENPFCSLAETAQACGYYDQSYFTKVFKDYMGTTPAAFVKKLQGMVRKGETIKK
ncbi:helix-turn-helix domain-containing protein [Acidaminococcus massiliensis]|uniref:helix-turn-helix domain-containing protein n=1 Tax=Acidaminococcus massiliensis TaxID=1852375 RepID=UPI0026DA9A40|nr:helix-turn-helix domain-containing protein [Acidaminococcus massiliensis]